MKVAIIAGGKATRLGDICKDKPKALLDINGKTILQRQIEAFYQNGKKEFVLILGHYMDQIEAACEDYKQLYPGVSFTFVKDDAMIGNTFAFWLAKPHAKEGIIVIDGDIVCDKGIIDLICNSEHNNALIVDKVRPRDNDDVKIIEKEGKVHKIGKYVSIPESDATSIGVQKFSAEDAPKLFATIEECFHGGLVKVFYEHCFEMAADNIDMHTVDKGHHRWEEIDFPNEYEEVLRNFK